MKTDRYRDQLGVKHCTPPTFANRLSGYGKFGASHYPCGCQPAIHRFKCSECGAVVGWCMGGDGTECDDCWVPDLGIEPMDDAS